MGNGARYKVQTRYGWFSLDEGSYRDYLAGKLLWIDWPPKRDANLTEKQEPLPPEASPQALLLRDRAAKQGLLKVLEEFGKVPPTPFRERMRDLNIYELNLSVRSGNGLMRGGIHTFGKLDELIRSEGGISSIRNLGVKSVKEIREAFLAECYARLMPYEKATFWQQVLDLNESNLSDNG